MSTDGSSSSRGLTFWEGLTLVFVGMKLAGVIDWSWWLVLSPILVPLGIVALVFLVAGLAALAGVVCDTIVEVRDELERRSNEKKYGKGEE